MSTIAYYVESCYLGLAVFVGGLNETDWFSAANLTDEKEFDNVTLTKKNVTQIEVSYKSSKSSNTPIILLLLLRVFCWLLINSSHSILRMLGFILGMVS